MKVYIALLVFQLSLELRKIQEVEIKFHLKAINGLDEANEVLKTTGYLEMVWMDEFLQWDPATYGGLTTSFWPQDDVWKPDVSLTYSYKDFKELGTTALYVDVNFEGYVGWHPFQVYESTCSIDIRYFPFDVQTCSLNFIAWSYTKHEVQMLSAKEGILIDDYESNPTWDIINTGWIVKEHASEAEISFSITMKRKPLHFSLTVMLPIALLAVLNIFVFVLPCESGERAGYAVTVFLSLAVFLTIVSSTLPANSETMSIFSIYLIIQTVQSTVITLVALLSLRIYSLPEDTPLPSCIEGLIKAKDKLVCKKRKQNNKIMDSSGSITSANNIISTVSISSTQPCEAETNDCELSNEIQLKYTWKHALNLLDIVFLIVFTTVFIISTAACFTASTIM